MFIVFYADDDADDLAVFSMILQETNADAKLIPVRTGKKLIDYIENETPPDPAIIFLDINMPDMNGFETLKAMKDCRNCKDVPVIILSNSANPMDIDRAYDLGAWGFIQKPKSYQNFREVLTDLLSNPDKITRRSKEDFIIKE